MKSDALLGAVLAGGASRRFGRDKAAETVGGRPLAARAAETLASVFPHVAIVSSREPAVPGWRHVPDLRPGQGPLAGIEAALTEADAMGLEGAFVLACDLPLVDAVLVRRVVDATGGAAACAPSRASHPGFEPLCAVYAVSCLGAVSEALDAGVLAVHQAFTAVGGTRVAVEAGRLLNVNSPEDAERAAAALGAGRGDAVESE